MFPFVLSLALRRILTAQKFCVKMKRNYLLVMLGHINLSPGTQFPGELKKTLHLCGVDTKVFSAHSTRSASVSKASAKDVPVHEIMARAGWKSAETFHKYYNKPVVQENSVASAVLGASPH